MGFKAYNTENGAFLVFFGPQFEEGDLKKVVSSSDEVYAILVFFDNESPVEKIYACEKYLNRMDVCYCGSNLASVYRDLVELKHSGHIRSVTIPPSLLYSGVELDEFELGYEDWNENGIPGRLVRLDAGAIDISDLKELSPYVESVVRELLSYDPDSDLERILLLDIWFQKNIQYIIGERTKTRKGIYVCKDMKGRESRAVDVLCSHFGRCEDIAFTASLVLNHPGIGIKCRQVGATKDGHSWNIVQCDGYEYYCDFTHNITRNPDQVPSAVKARSYCHDNTFLGKDRGYQKYGSTDIYEHARLAEQSLDDRIISSALISLESKGVSLTWGDSVVMGSSFIPG